MELDDLFYKDICVSLEDIELGKPGSPEWCPIARGIRRAYPDHDVVPNVDSSEFVVFIDGTEYHASIAEGRHDGVSINKFTDAFDLSHGDSQSVVPFKRTFRFEIPPIEDDEDYDE